MCLSVIAVEPSSEWPVRVLSFREEFLERAWDPPARWWPEHPHVVGGRDQRAGGTWLAVAPAARRAAAIHTSFVERVPEERRRTRGEIPVAAAAGVAWDERDLTCYDDFTLLAVDGTDVTWHAYRDGDLSVEAIDPGLHLGSVAGLGPDTPRPRHRHWTDAIAASGLPKLDATGSPGLDWQPWLERIGAAAMEPTDELALLIRRQARDRLFGTSAVSFVAFPDTGDVSFHTLADPLGRRGVALRWVDGGRA